VRARVAGLIRLAHPFPSLLDGVVCGAVALVAGGSLADAGRLAASMVALQAGIGTINDLVDAPHDAGHKPGKPIPAGLVEPGVARLVAATTFAMGLALALPSGRQTLALGLLVIAIGLTYDLWLKGTALSWLPFATGIPLLPVYGWLGATDSLPGIFLILVPIAVLAGAALAIGNALADLERDEAAGIGSIAVAIGARRGAAVHLALVAAVGLAAVLSAVALGGSIGQVALVCLAATVPVVAAGVGSGGGPGRRERAWEAEAVGFALLAPAWLWVAIA
jgi:4-hydroxybenzoate polyprenyltransferase